LQDGCPSVGRKGIYFVLAERDIEPLVHTRQQSKQPLREVYSSVCQGKASTAGRGRIAAVGTEGGSVCS